MKTKAISQKKLTKKEFFLLMIAPLLIGAFITLLSASNANASWKIRRKGSINLLYYKDGLNFKVMQPKKASSNSYQFLKTFEQEKLLKKSY